MIRKSSNFVTDRLKVGEWRSLSVGHTEMAHAVAAILTPKVTQSLPEDWRGEYSNDRVAQWLEDIDREATTLLVLDRSSNNPIGLMILFEEDEDQSERSVRVGYMLAETAWGQGYATELLHGLVDWCRTVEITSIIGGVAKDNVASRHVMEKCGFEISPSTQADVELLYELDLR
jgi:ribosomal-protein-alanine N-acetyltransferase